MEQGTAHSAGGYGPPGGGGYGGPPGAPPGGGGYGPPGGGYGGPPGGGGFGGPPGGGGYGGHPGAPPGGGYGAPPGGFGGGAPPPGGFGAPPPGGFGPPQQFGPPGGFVASPGSDVNTTLPLILGIASIFVCSNLLFGIIGIVFAIQANTCLAAGDVEGARSKVKTSYLLTGIGAVLTVVAWVSFVVFFGMLGAMSSV